MTNLSRVACGMLVAASITIYAMICSPVATANGLPSDVILHESGAILLPRPQSPLCVDRADIVMDVRDYRAQIHTTYQVSNPGPERLREQVAFFVPDGSDVEGLETVVAGRQVEHLLLKGNAGQVVPPGTLPEPDELWVDPLSGARYQPANPWSTRGRPAVFVFPVEIGPRETCKVEVKYRQVPSVDYGRLVRPLYRYDYHLWPARHWSSFGPISMRILSGGQQRAVRSNCTAVRREGNRTIGDSQLDGIPVDVLSVYVYSGAITPWVPWPLNAIWLGRWGRIAVIVAVCSLAGVAAGRVARRKRPGARLLSLALCAGVLGLAYLGLPLSSGSGWAFVMLFMFFPVLVLLTFGLRWAFSGSGDYYRMGP
ncbi:MAG: hypothetical protein HPY55_09820 [Firmicutes bacterium]|nr:hypothetical protein [Bacillota bacterium]